MLYSDSKEQVPKLMYLIHARSLSTRLLSRIDIWAIRTLGGPVTYIFCIQPGCSYDKAQHGGQIKAASYYPVTSFNYLILNYERVRRLLCFLGVLS